jgi:AraC-like DNA-binding protein
MITAITNIQNTMSENRRDLSLKYRIKAILLRRYPDDQERAAIIQQLSSRLNVSPNHLRKMTNYTQGSPNEVRLSQLKIIADFLGVSPESLVISYE